MEEKYCERCGLYLGKVLKTRRYCKECANAVKRKKTADWWKEHPDYIRASSDESRQEENTTKEKPKYSLKQVNDKAKELGMSYGHYSDLLAQGKVDPPDER